MLGYKLSVKWKWHGAYYVNKWVVIRGALLISAYSISKIQANPTEKAYPVLDSIRGLH